MAYADPSQEPLTSEDRGELGRSLGGSIYFREYNMRFVGTKALDEYEKMRRGDGQVRATMRMAKAPIVSANWYIEPASADDKDKEVAAFVEWNRTNMSRSWKQVLWESLLMLDYGWYCVDAETEILTEHGWRRYSDLAVGDEALTLNMETGLSEWQPVDAVNVFTDGPFPIVQMEGRSHSSVTTSDHRWPTRKYDTKALTETTTRNLNTNDCLIRAVPSSGIPASPKYSDSLVELVGWFWTEGQVNPNGAVSIWQNEGPNADRIRRCLTDLFGAALTQTRNGRNRAPAGWVERAHRGALRHFYLNLEASEPLVDLIPGKVVPAHFVRSLTAAQLLLFVEVSILADGTRRGDKASISQVRDDRLDAVEIACALLGVPTTRARRFVSGKFKPGYISTLHLGKQTTIRPIAAARRGSKFKVEHSSTPLVWCPRVANGTWLARRRGTVYFTGNSFEKVYRQAEWRVPGRERGPRKQVTAWQKLAPRHPRQLEGFVFDSNGGVAGINFNVQPPSSNTTEKVFIPIEKLLLFTFDEEGGQPEGFSLLRTVHKHWYYKENLYKIDGIQKERHGIGIPKIVLPQSANAGDKALAAQMARNLRTNEKAEIVIPFGWDVGFAQLEGSPIDVLKSAEHHDLMIAKTLLVQFLNLGTSESGSRATGSTLVDIFVKSQRYVADLISEIFNQYAIPQLVDYNYSVDEYPKLKVRKLGEETDHRALSVSLRNLIEGGAFTPTPEDEEYLREVIDFPRAPKAALSRLVAERVRVKGSQGGTGAPESSPTAPSSSDTTNRTSKPADG